MDHQQDCGVEPLAKPVDRAALARSKAVYLAVTGMECPRCATRVNNSLLSLNGVIESNVFFHHGFAAVAYDPARVDALALIQQVARAGLEIGHQYQARVITEIAMGETYQQ